MLAYLNTTYHKFDAFLGRKLEVGKALLFNHLSIPNADFYGRQSKLSYGTVGGENGAGGRSSDGGGGCGHCGEYDGGGAADNTINANTMSAVVCDARCG